MKTSIAIAIIFFHFPVIKGSSNLKEKEAVESVFFLIYNQQYDEAESILLGNGKNYEPFYSDVLKLDLYWWKYISAPTPDESEKLNRLLKDIGESNQTSLDEKLQQLIMLSYRVRFELMRFNIPGAYILRIKIKNLLAEIKRDELNYPESRLKLYDLYNELFLYFDNIINPLFLDSKRNTRANALLQIENYAKDDNLIVKTMAHYFLGKIYLNIEKEPHKGIRHFNYLTRKYPDNSIFGKLAKNCREKS